MLSLIFLAGGIHAVLTLKTDECTGQHENYRFKQGCNECWCHNGIALCTNKGCSFGTDSDEDEDDANDDDDNGLKLSRRSRKGNAIGTQAWDLGSRFPKKRSRQKPSVVTPYPPSFRYRYHLRIVPQPPDIQKYPKLLAYRHPDPGGLNVLDEKYIQYPSRYRRDHTYPAYDYLLYAPEAPSPSNGAPYYTPPLFYEQY